MNYFFVKIKCVKQVIIKRIRYHIAFFKRFLPVNRIHVRSVKKWNNNTIEKAIRYEVDTTIKFQRSASIRAREDYWTVWTDYSAILCNTFWPCIPTYAIRIRCLRYYKPLSTITVPISMLDYFLLSSKSNRGVHFMYHLLIILLIILQARNISCKYSLYIDTDNCFSKFFFLFFSTTKRRRRNVSSIFARRSQKKKKK